MTGIPGQRGSLPGPVPEGERHPAALGASSASPNGFVPVGAPMVDEDTIDLRQLLSILRRRVWLIIGVALATLAGTTFVVLRQAPQYRATATIRLLNERQAVAGGISSAALDQALGRSADPLHSQMQVLKSRMVVAPVVEQLGLRLRPVNGVLGGVALRDVVVPELSPRDTLHLEFHEAEYEVRSGGEGPVRAPYGTGVQVSGVRFTVSGRPDVERAQFEVRSQSEIVNWIITNLRATQREWANVVDVEFTAGNPVLAQRVVNAMITEFQAASSRESQQQATRRRAFVEAQLTQTDSVLAEAQAALTEFQRREEVYSLEQRFIAQQAGQFTLDIRREELDADLRMLRSLLRRLEEADGPDRELHTVISTPTVAQNQLVAQLYGQLVQYETERASLTTGSWSLAESHPDVQRLTTLVAETRARLVDAVASHLMALEARLAALDQLRARNTAALQSLPATGAEEARLRQQVETIHKMADQLREEYQRARIAEAVEAGQVTILDAALVPDRPIGSRRGMKLALGLMLGLMLGSGLAFLLEQMNTTIRSRADLEAMLGLPALAIIPRLELSGAAGAVGAAGWAPRLRRLLGPVQEKLPLNGRGGGLELVTTSDQHYGGSEAYRMLRTSLLFSRAGQRLRTVVVTSTAPSEGKTTTAANLAVTFAQQGMRVLLIDCDLRRSRLHNLFQLTREPGLTQLLIEAPEASGAIRRSGVEGLDLLPAGILPPNPAELLGGEGMRQLVERLQQEYELVIFDAPPVLAATDAAVLSKVADGVLFVVRAGATERGALQQALDQLRMVGAPVLGAVLNDPDQRLEATSGGYYYYYYGERAEV